MTRFLTDCWSWDLRLHNSLIAEKWARIAEKSLKIIAEIPVPAHSFCERSATYASRPIEIVRMNELTHDYFRWHDTENRPYPEALHPYVFFFKLPKPNFSVVGALLIVQLLFLIHM